MSFEEAKQYLRREDDQGNSLYEHLSRVLLKIIVEKPENVNETFEQISQELRGTLHGSKSLLLAESNPQGAMSDEVSQLQWCNSRNKSGVLAAICRFMRLAGPGFHLTGTWWIYRCKLWRLNFLLLIRLANDHRRFRSWKLSVIPEETLYFLICNVANVDSW